MYEPGWEFLVTTRIKNAPLMLCAGSTYLALLFSSRSRRHDSFSNPASESLGSILRKIASIPHALHFSSFTAVTCKVVLHSILFALLNPSCCLRFASCEVPMRGATVQYVRRSTESSFITCTRALFSVSNVPSAAWSSFGELHTDHECGWPQCDLWTDTLYSHQSHNQDIVHAFP